MPLLLRNLLSLPLLGPRVATTTALFAVATVAFAVVAAAAIVAASATAVDVATTTLTSVVLVLVRVIIYIMLFLNRYERCGCFVRAFAAPACSATLFAVAKMSRCNLG